MLRSKLVFVALLMTGLTPPGSTGSPGATGNEPLPPRNADVPPALPRPAPTHVADYQLRVSVDPTHHTMRGSGTISLHNTSTATLTSVWLHLYLNAFKNERSVFLRQAVGAFRGSSRPAQWGAIDVRAFRDGGTDLWPNARFSEAPGGDETDVEIPLVRPLAPGESRDFYAEWDATLPSIVERTGFAESFHFAGQWFPKLAKLEPDGRFDHFAFHHLSEFYANFGRYDVTIVAPPGFRVGATGVRREESIEDTPEGKRQVLRYQVDDVHDFAFTYWDHYEERETMIGSVKVHALFPKGYEAAIGREIEALRFAIPHFAERYGAYPYPTLTLVHPPEHLAHEAGGMEYPTLITTGGPWYTPEAVRTLELVTIHEFGHQYFYGLFASNEHATPFLDEGLNSYAEGRALAEWLGEGSAGALWGLRVSDTSVQAAASKGLAEDQAVGSPAPSFLTGRHYARLVYSRTATVLETLRRVYGDAPMRAAMAAYAARARFAHPTTEDLLTSLTECVGAEAAEVARVALLGRGTIDVRIDHVSRSRETDPHGLFDEGGKRVTRTGATSNGEHVGRVLILRRGNLRLPVDLKLTFEDGSEQVLRDLRFEGQALEAPYQGPARLRSAILDPEHKILLDEDPTNHTFGPGGSFRTVAEQTSFWTEVLWRWLLP